MSAQRKTTILLTRSIEDNAEWAAELRTLGFKPIELECIETVLLASGPELCDSLQHADWLACTSRRAVDALHHQQPNLPSALRLAAVGPGTAQRMRSLFGRCDLISAEGTGTDLGRALVDVKACTPIIITARDGRTDIEHALVAGGLSASRFELYAVRPIRAPLRAKTSLASVAFFASPSAVRAFAARCELASGCIAISLGPSTSSAMHEAAIPVHGEARTRDLAGMLEALATTSLSQR